MQRLVGGRGGGEGLAKTYEDLKSCVRASTLLRVGHDKPR